MMIKSVMKILCCVLFAVLPGLIFPAGGPEYAKLRPKLKKSASASVPDAGDPVKYFHDNKYDGVRLTTPDGIEFTVRFIRDGKPGGDIAVRKNGKPYYRQPLSTLPKKQGRNKKR